ncbi:MAG: hypothetical protein ACYTBX_06855 [Planctomycetota bacterium]
MKQSGTTTVFAVVCVAVLLGAWGIGLCIRQVRFRHAGIQSKAGANPKMIAEIQKPGDAREPERDRAKMAQIRPERRPMPDREGGPAQRRGEGREGMPMFQMLPPEEAAKLRERWPNMSEEEREKFTAQMLERWENMSEEEREQARERRSAEMRQRRERLEYMSEEEREEFRAQMRERFGGRRPRGGGEGGRRRPGARRRENDLE